MRQLVVNSTDLVAGARVFFKLRGRPFALSHAMVNRWGSPARLETRRLTTLRDRHVRHTSHPPPPPVVDVFVVAGHDNPSKANMLGGDRGLFEPFTNAALL